MNGPIQVRPVPLGALLASLVAIAGLLGFAFGAGSWQGEVRQILVEHERRLNAHALRDDRQDNHMEKIDEVASDTRTMLARMKYQVDFLVRRARADEP